MSDLDPAGLEAAAKAQHEKGQELLGDRFRMEPWESVHPNVRAKIYEELSAALAAYLSVQEQPDERETYRAALERIAGMGGFLTFAGDVARAALAVRDTEQQEQEARKVSIDPRPDAPRYDGRWTICRDCAEAWPTDEWRDRSCGCETHTHEFVTVEVAWLLSGEQEVAEADGKRASLEQDLSDAGDRCEELIDALLLMAASHTPAIVSDEDDSGPRIAAFVQRGLLALDGESDAVTLTRAGSTFVEEALLDLPYQRAITERRAAAPLPSGLEGDR